MCHYYKKIKKVQPKRWILIWFVQHFQNVIKVNHLVTACILGCNYLNFELLGFLFHIFNFSVLLSFKVPNIPKIFFINVSNHRGPEVWIGGFRQFDTPQYPLLFSVLQSENSKQLLFPRNDSIFFFLNSRTVFIRNGHICMFIFLLSFLGTCHFLIVCYQPQSIILFLASPPQAMRYFKQEVAYIIPMHPFPIFSQSTLPLVDK